MGRDIVGVLDKRHNKEHVLRALMSSPNIPTGQHWKGEGSQWAERSEESNIPYPLAIFLSFPVRPVGEDVWAPCLCLLYSLYGLEGMICRTGH